jgi:hypothetical protein
VWRIQRRVWQKQRGGGENRGGVAQIQVGVATVAKIWGMWRNPVICFALFCRALRNVLTLLVALNDLELTNFFVKSEKIVCSSLIKFSFFSVP